MTSSEVRRRSLGCVLAIGSLLGAPWVLACGIEGDLGSMGCPPGEVCGMLPPGEVTFTRSIAIDCHPPSSLIAHLLSNQSQGSTAVMLGGRTSASLRAAPPGAEGRFSAHFAPIEGTEEAVAVMLGPGRFTAYQMDGVVLDYVAMPIMTRAAVAVTDEVTCADRPQAVLRGLPVRLRPLVYAADRTALVDTSAFVESPAGDGTITALEGDSIAVTVVVGGERTTVTLPVVDGADEIQPLLSVTDQLRGDFVADGITSVCFRARTGEVSLLGVPIEDLTITGPYRETFSESPDLNDAWHTRYPMCLLLAPTDGAAGRGEVAFRMAGIPVRYGLRPE